MKKQIVNVHEAKTHLSRLLDRAHNGEEIILAKGGVEWARLMPLEQRQPRKPGDLKGMFTVDDSFFAPLSDEEMKDWEGRDDE